MNYLLDQEWKHGGEAIATLGDRITLATFDFSNNQQLSRQDYDTLRERIGAPATLGEYARLSSHDLDKYYWATGRALAGFNAKRVLPTAVKEAAAGTCAQFDNLYPPKFGIAGTRGRVKDGCRAPSELVNRWMADRDPDAVASGFYEHDDESYKTKQRSGVFMLEKSRDDKIDEFGIAPAFRRFARAYPEAFAEKFDGVPPPLKESIVTVVESEARKARESGIKARESRAAKLAGSVVLNANYISDFFGTKEPIVARKIVEREFRDARHDARENRHQSLADLFTRWMDGKNDAIVNAAIDLVSNKEAKDVNILRSRCLFLSKARSFHGIGIETKQKAESRYSELCRIHRSPGLDLYAGGRGRGHDQRDTAPGNRRQERLDRVRKGKIRQVQVRDIPPVPARAVSSGKQDRRGVQERGLRSRCMQ